MNHKDLQELIAALRSQQEKVEALDAFLDLKQSELRPENEMSFFGFLQAQEQLHIERSVLAGHALMLERAIRTKQIKLDLESRSFLRQIQVQVRRIPFSQ
jgi:hypothetical protein